MTRHVNRRRRATDRRGIRRVGLFTGRVADRRSRLVWTEEEVLLYLQRHADDVHLPDEQLVYWADLYEEERAAARGIPFGVFITNPHGLCRVFDIPLTRVIGAVPEGVEVRPLLPAQCEVFKQIHKW